MQAFIGSTLLMSKEAQPRSKPFEIYDCRLSRFTLRIQPSARTTRASDAAVVAPSPCLAPGSARRSAQRQLAAELGLGSAISAFTRSISALERAAGRERQPRVKPNVTGPTPILLTRLEDVAD
jgi:hypothetical protein